MTLDQLNKAIIESPTAELYFERGRLLWQQQEHARAMADYERSVALAGPGCPAATALVMCRRIMAFYHRDRYNP